MKKITLIASVIGIAAVAWVYFFMYAKPHPAYKKLKPDYTLAASELYGQFTSSPEKFAAQYNGKMLAVRGVLSQLDQSDSTETAYFILEEGIFGYQGVRIVLLPGEVIQHSDTAAKATMAFKGLCVGFNETDVILEHGSILRNQ